MKVGLEILLEEGEPSDDCNVGLVTNQTAVDDNLKHAIPLLLDRGYQLRKVFTPEHGLYGYHSAGEEVESHSGKPDRRYETISLYGERRKPEPEDLEEIDLLFYDIQDVGVRFYTYIYTLANTLRAAGEQELEVQILDRPNPLGGQRVRGPSLPRSHHSFVGDYDLPIQYGLTPGEFALYLQERFGLGKEVSVIELEGWSRDTTYQDLGRPWVPPSPNIPDFQTTQLYPGTCLFEGTNLSEGRGTALPFKIFGAPWMNSDQLKTRIENIQSSTIALRETHFRPSDSKYEGEVCHGFQMHPTAEDPRPIVLVGKIIWTVNEIYQQRFQWRKSEGKYFIDELLGGSEFRRMVDGGADRDTVTSFLSRSADDFEVRKEKYHLYPYDGE